MKKGFTLVEVMLAGAVLAIGCLGVLSMLLTVIGQNNTSKNRTTATYLAEMRLNQLELQSKHWNSNNTPWATVRNAATGSGANNWTVENAIYSQTGSILDTSDIENKKYTIGYYVLANAANGSDFVRGAIRVAWAVKGNAQCPVGFDVLDTHGADATLCDMITLPFAFQKQTH